MSSDESFTLLWNFLSNDLPFGRPRLNVNETDIARVAPHLDREEVRELLEQGKKERVAFVGPGLAIRGALHHYFLCPISGTTMMYRSHAIRLKASYACTQPPRNLLEPDLPYLERAVDFAEIHWGEELLWDRANDAVHGNIIPPPGSDQTTVEFVTLFEISIAGLLMDLAPLEPVSETLDDMSLGTYRPRFAAEEALGQRTPYPANFCGRCGGGLSQTKCSFCGMTYDFGGLTTSEWSMPLCLTMQEAAIGAKYKFEIDPIEARKAEHRAWAKSNFVLLKREVDPPLRSIMLGDKP